MAQKKSALYIARHVRGNIAVRLETTLRLPTLSLTGHGAFAVTGCAATIKTSRRSRGASPTTARWAGLGSTTVLHQLGILRSGNGRRSSTRTRCTTLRTMRSSTRSTMRCRYTSPSAVRSAATPRSDTSRSKRRTSGMKGAMRWPATPTNASLRLGTATTVDRAGWRQGRSFLATFDKGAIGRARSESKSSFVLKLMHEHLATEARQEMWSGQAAGSVTCGCMAVCSAGPLLRR